ncbi:MAG: hypothetical protein R3B90_03215 [Planctomycetaceae bacterium]
MAFEREIEVGLAAVRQAAKACRRAVRDRPRQARQADKSLVTVADFASQAIICKALLDRIPWTTG